ncbi:IS3 family transposase, partial [Actinomyces trachealis]|uniref:IS3 family transposase n=1 Tax=Actinomyces trachealis TaxID=2763540 RepID=UPI002E2B0522
MSGTLRAAETTRRTHRADPALLRPVTTGLRVAQDLRDAGPQRHRGGAGAGLQDHAPGRTGGLPAPSPTTILATGIQTCPDLVQWDFTAQAPGRKWVGDITCIPTWDGHAYLATVMDCYSRKIIGYAIASYMCTSLVTQALDMDTRNCLTEPGHTIFHSDKGSQYTSEEYAQAMARHGIQPSLGRTGSCYDNAAAQSFNTALKKELVNRKIYPTRDKAIKD